MGVRGEGSCVGQLCSCLDNVKVCDSWGTFHHYWWMRKHHVHPKLILKYNDNSFSMNRDYKMENMNFVTPLMTTMDPPPPTTTTTTTSMHAALTWETFLSLYLYCLSRTKTRAGLIHSGGAGNKKSCQILCPPSNSQVS